jgi:hypothetical protein
MLPHLRLEPILSDSDRLSQFLQLVGELLEFTFQDIVQPFAKTKHDHGGNTSFEWVFAFSSWCGKLCARLTSEEAKNLIIAPIWARDIDTALLILQSLMRSFMIEAFLGDKEIKDEHIALWSEMTEWLRGKLPALLHLFWPAARDAARRSALERNHELLKSPANCLGPSR